MNEHSMNVAAANVGGKDRSALYHGTDFRHAVEDVVE
jgi:hypothetical protein